MKLDVTSKVFRDTWKDIFDGDKSKIPYMLEILEPHLRWWEAMLSGTASRDNIHYLGLYGIIENRLKHDPTEYIESWVKEINLIDSLYDLLHRTAFRLLLKFKYFPKYARPHAAELVYATLFKRMLSDQVYSLARKRLDTIQFETKFHEEAITDLSPDYLLLDNLKLTQWQRYLMMLRAQGFTPFEIADIMHIPRETFYYEEKEIWQQLKQKYSSEKE